MTTRRHGFELALGLLGVLAFLIRLAYLLAQPASDPDATGAILDGASYMRWGLALAEGSASPQGAYYLAPLYAWLLGGFFKIFGDEVAWLYLLQHAAVIVTALLLASLARRLAGATAGIATAALLLLYHPALYFASRPLGEPVALLLLVLALWLLSRSSPLACGAAGVLVALSALARPNFLLVIAIWLLVGVAWLWSSAALPEERAGDRRRRGAALGLAVASVVLVLTPVAIRNWRASGHLVPISANAGLTLYHGNGPGAVGIRVQATALSGRVSTQREEATALASRLAARPMDDVEADRWWGRRALRTRLAEPLDTLVLMLRKSALLISTRELDLDYAPSIDENPWRRAAPLPFALLLGLAATALMGAGFRRSGGAIVWGAILACAATPLLFYVSSRYRLPLAFLLALPAGVGLATLVAAKGRRRWLLLALGLIVAVASAIAPARQVAAMAQAGALANRAVSWKQFGDAERAARDLRLALTTDPRCAPAHFGMGVLLAEQGETGEAEEHYREALALRPDFVEAAHNLSTLLVVDGRAVEAVQLLQRAFEYRPDHVGCWKNLIVAHYLLDDTAAVRSVVERARRSGVRLDPAWLAGLEAAHEDRKQ